MKRGIVMSINDQYAVVMTADGGFLRAPIQGTPQIGEEIIFEEEYREVRRRPTIRSVYGYSGAAAIVLILFLPLLFMMMKDSNPIVAYVSMDINPSVEIGIDSSDRVRSLHALNKDGEKIVSGIAYKGVAVELVAASILEKARESHYLDVADKDIVITSMVMKGGDGGSNDYDQLLSGKISDTLIERLTELAAQSITANVTALAIPSELRDEAAANGVSSGKMAVYLMAKDEGYEIKLEQLKTQSIDSVTASIGGVKTIVDNAADTSKSKLKELVDREKAEKKNKDEKSSQKPSSTAKPTATAKPNGAEKPAVTNNDDKKQEDRGQGGRKPAATPNNGKKPTSTDKAAIGKKDDNNRGGKDRGSKDDNDGNRGSDDDDDDNNDRGQYSGRGDNDNDDRDVDKDDNKGDDRDDDRGDDRDDQDKDNDRGGRGGGWQSGRNDN